MQCIYVINLIVPSGAKWLANLLLKYICNRFTRQGTSKGACLCYIVKNKSPRRNRHYNRSTEKRRPCGCCHLLSTFNDDTALETADYARPRAVAAGVAAILASNDSPCCALRWISGCRSDMAMINSDPVRHTHFKHSNMSWWEARRCPVVSPSTDPNPPVLILPSCFRLLGGSQYWRTHACQLHRRRRLKLSTRKFIALANGTRDG